MSNDGPDLAPDTQVDFKGVGDWTSWTSALVLLCVLPFTLIALYPFTLILGGILGGILPGDYADWWAILNLAYFAALPLLLIPRFHRIRVRLFFREALVPTTTQLARLERLWQSVLQDVGKGPKTRFRLMLADEPRLNAAAGAGRVVLVTRPALNDLTDSQLRAVLAHEYGHHVGLYPIILIARLWLLVPLEWLHWLGRILHNALAALAHIRTNILFAFMVWYFILSLRMMLFVHRQFIRVITLILLYFGRQAEYKADLVAVKLGYGEELVSALVLMEESLQDAPADQRPPSKSKPFEETHPPTANRISRINAAIASR